MHRVDYDDRRCLAKINTVTSNSLSEVSAPSSDGSSWKSEISAAPFSVSYDVNGNYARIQSNKLYVSIHDAAGTAYACCRLKAIPTRTYNRRELDFDNA